VRSEPSKVLLVTDDAESQQVWTSVLERHHLVCAVAGPASDVLDHWEEDGFDLAIVDARNRRDGPPLCRRLRVATLNPILLLSAECDEVHCLEAYRAGADECIQKPVSPAVLVAKVRAWLRHAWTVRAESLAPLHPPLSGA
jgi:DNA-binding response OmpR family regulator